MSKALIRNIHCGDAITTTTNHAIPTTTNNAIPTTTNHAIPTTTNHAIPTTTNHTIPTTTNHTITTPKLAARAYSLLTSNEPEIKDATSKHSNHPSFLWYIQKG